jgi:alanyl-tRNA synthetase
MSVSSVSNQTSTATLQKNEQTLLNQIKQLQGQDADKNAPQIKQLQAQANQIETQILEAQSSQASSSVDTTTTTNPLDAKIGPAYTVQLQPQTPNQTPVLGDTTPTTVNVAKS